MDWCPEPPKVHGGKVEVNGRRAGSVATYTCQSGFILFGTPVSIFLLLRDDEINKVSITPTKRKCSTHRFYPAVWAAIGREKLPRVSSLIAELRQISTTAITASSMIRRPLEVSLSIPALMITGWKDRNDRFALGKGNGPLMLPHANVYTIYILYCDL